VPLGSNLFYSEHSSDTIAVDLKIDLFEKKTGVSSLDLAAMGAFFTTWRISEGILSMSKILIISCQIGLENPQSSGRKS